jgi:hypothetical protein
MEESFHKERRH